MKEFEVTKKIDVRSFIFKNITSYEWDDSFLQWPTKKTKELWEDVKKELKVERNNWWCKDIDTKTISTITSHEAWYINRDLEEIVWLQTDEPLKRAIKPFWWIRVVENAVKEKGMELSEDVKEIFKYAKNHNDAVFSAYDAEIKNYRSRHIVTGLPDNYARWRIIWDYRRLALYGVDRLIEEKNKEKAKIPSEMSEEIIREKEELTQQIVALQDIKIMAEKYELDVSSPAKNAKEAVQWIYFAYLAAVKEQDGAAMSLWNVSSFLDIYIEKDLKKWILTETGAQELVDHFIIKLRIVRHLRPAAYDVIFGWDPTWVTETIGWQFLDGKTKVTKTSFRFLQTLYNLGASPEPNLTVLRAENLPQWFKNFCSKVSIDTSSLQYENDDLMREKRCSDDYWIACCVSHQELGKSIQHFGARSNLPKAFLLALNEGYDQEGYKIVDNVPKLSDGELNYDEVWANFKIVMWEVARVYAKSMYIIHYMHDKYYYEKAQMAFVDTKHNIDIAYGAAGLSIVADSLSAIKYAKVKAIRNEKGRSCDFDTHGDFPMFGNDNNDVDNIAQEVVKCFFDELCKHKTYKNATPTLSLLTITSNVMYGEHTGATPDGRKAWDPFAPGANPMHGRDSNGAIASLNSVAKMDYDNARDGISNTFSIVPKALGADEEEQTENLTNLMNGYFSKGAHHLNVNVLNRKTLQDAYDHPEEYPQLTIRVSGYAVNFVKLSKAHQLEVIARTFHESM